MIDSCCSAEDVRYPNIPHKRCSIVQGLHWALAKPIIWTANTAQTHWERRGWCGVVVGRVWVVRGHVIAFEISKDTFLLREDGNRVSVKKQHECGSAEDVCLSKHSLPLCWRERIVQEKTTHLTNMCGSHSTFEHLTVDRAVDGYCAAFDTLRSTPQKFRK